MLLPKTRDGFGGECKSRILILILCCCCYSLFRHAFKRASDSAIVHLSSCTPSSLLASGRGHLEGY